MKKLFTIIVMFGLLLIPFLVYAQSEQTTANVPPVGQALIPEGDFALRLVEVLKLGTPATETEAEDTLTKAGIAPKNGWIADYPMTPIIIGQLEGAVVSAADSKKLSLGKDDALKAYRDLTTEFGLNVVAETSGQYAENQPEGDREYSNSSEINNYYNDEGPPVVTYYPPPPDYGYLYTWAPYPFWCSGFFFPGFFVLNDFDVIVVVGHHHHHRHHHVVSNHFIDPKTHAVLRVGPTMKTIGKTVNTSLTHTPKLTGTRGFNSTEAKKGATSIFNRSRERVRSANAVTGTTVKGYEVTVPRGTTNQPGNSERRNGMNFQRPSAGQGRAAMVPNRGFNAGSEGSGRSFSPPSRSFSVPLTGGSSSFGGFQGGGFGSFHGGGFSGGSHR